MGYGKAHQKIGKKGQARDIPEWRKAEPCKTRRRRRASAVAHRARPSTFGEKRAAAQASMPGVARAGRAGLASARPACGHSLARGSRGVASGPMGAHRDGEANPRQTGSSTGPGQALRRIQDGRIRANSRNPRNRPGTSKENFPRKFSACCGNIGRQSGPFLSSPAHFPKPIRIGVPAW